MKLNGNISDLAKALIAFQGEVANPKNTAVNEYANGHRYAPLGEILSTVRPILAKHGLAVVQDAKIDGNTVVITTTLFHESGQFLESEPLVLPAAGKGGVTAQTIGAAITYGRRYQLSAILGISSEDDDDANSISMAPDPKPGPADQQKKQEQKPQKQSAQNETKKEQKQQSKQETKQEVKQQQQGQQADKNDSEKQFKLVSYEEGVAPSGVPFARFDVANINTGEKMTVLAKDTVGVKLSKRIPKDQPFSMEIAKFNNFNILKSVNGVSVEDMENPGGAGEAK